MYLTTSIVSVLLVLSLLVFVHELGHFVMAKRAKVKVEEFAFGFPPRIFAVKRGETEYAINALPLGGYVRMVGEEDPTQENSLASKTPWQRITVLVAGSTMNFLLAILLFAVTFMLGVAVAEPTNDIVVVGVVQGSPAATAGLRTNDVIVRLDTHPIQTTADLQAYTQEKLGQEISLLIKRDGEILPPLTLTPRTTWPDGQGPMGVQIANYRTVIKSFPWWEALGMGAERAVSVVGLTFYAPIMVAKGLLPADQARPVGLVGITQLTGSVVSQIPTSGWMPVFNLIALLSASLAVVNILPLPGLDGGRLVFVLLEWIRRGKRISPEKEGMIHLAGLALLMGLMLIITYYDIVNPIKIPGMGTP